MCTYQRIGIVGAMDVEVNSIIAQLVNPMVTDACGMRFYDGALGSHEVVVVKSGVGKVNAALCCQVLVDRMHADAIVNTGVAGSLDARMDIGDVVVATDVVHHDVDATVFGYAPGEIPQLGTVSFLAAEDVSAVAAAAVAEVSPSSGVWRGRVASGDQFVADDATKSRIAVTFDALCCEMEGAAVAQACTLNGVPFAIVRAISDKADGSQQVDYPTFEAWAAEVSARIVVRAVDLL